MRLLTQDEVPYVTGSGCSIGWAFLGMGVGGVIGAVIGLPFAICTATASFWVGGLLGIIAGLCVTIGICAAVA